MASPGSQALVKRSTDSALMPPPPPPRRIKRPSTVLDEDTYTDALSHIIARDFFPGLLEVQAQQEYLNALESKDKEWIGAAGKRLTEVMTPGPDGRRKRGRRGTSMAPSVLAGGETPRGWVGDTPVSVAGTEVSAAESTASTATPKPDVNLSLTAFQAKYTSEDNESFNALLDKQNAKKREKLAWVWNQNRVPSNRRIAQEAVQQKRIEAARAARDNDRWAVTTTTSATDGKESNDKALVPAPRLSTDLDARPASLDHKPTNPRNALMFTPEGIEDTQPHHQTITAAAEARSNAPSRAVRYDNTRLPIPAPSSSDTVPLSPSLSAIDAAIAGRPRPTASEPGYTGGDTPRVRGYAFVAEPTPEEEAAERAALAAAAADRHRRDADALLARLTAAASDGTTTATTPTPNPFTIRESNRREALHHRLVDRIAGIKRQQQQSSHPPTPSTSTKTTKTPTLTPRSSRIAGHTLTPAARSLLGRLGTPTPSSGLGVGSPARSAGFGEAFGDAKTPLRRGKGAARRASAVGGRWTPAVTPKGRMGTGVKTGCEGGK